MEFIITCAPRNPESSEFIRYYMNEGNFGARVTSYIANAKRMDNRTALRTVRRLIKDWPNQIWVAIEDD